MVLDPTLQNTDAAEFEASLNHKVKGLFEAAKIVTNVIQSYMAGLNDPNPAPSQSSCSWARPAPARPGLFVLAGEQASRTRAGRNASSNDSSPQFPRDFPYSSNACCAFGDNGVAQMVTRLLRVW